MSGFGHEALKTFGSLNRACANRWPLASRDFDDRQNA
jgi:hypothetical protein